MLPLSPAKALPLFAVAEVNAYRISLKPCGPTACTEASPAGSTVASAVNPRYESGRQRMASMVIFTSRDSIFLPRYSGVRPTIRPATNTAMIANSSMP